MIDITITKGRLSRDTIILGVLIPQNFTRSVSSDLQVAVVSWFPFLMHPVTVIHATANFRLICYNMACTSLSCAGRQSSVFC